MKDGRAASRYVAVVQSEWRCRLHLGQRDAEGRRDRSRRHDGHVPGALGAEHAYLAVLPVCPRMDVDGLQTHETEERKGHYAQDQPLHATILA